MGTRTSGSVGGQGKRSGSKDRHRASGLPNHVVQLANQALDEVRRAYWNELRSLGEKDAAKRFNEDTTQDPPRWLPGDCADRAATAPVGGPPA